MTANRQSRDKMVPQHNRLSGLLLCNMSETDELYRLDMFTTLIDNNNAQLLTNYYKKVNGSDLVIEFNKES